MAPWTWVVLGLATLALVELWVLRVARKRGQGDGRHSGQGAFTGIDAPTASAPDDDADTVTCPDCGAVNDADFSYCAECVTPLP